MANKKPRTSGVEDLLRRHAPNPKLDIGCGGNHDPSWIGIDIQKLPGVDIVHDIETYPWPLPDACIELAMASHIAEHINPVKFGFINWMNEIWRVLRPGARLMMSMPYGFSSGFCQDPTHCNPCNENTWRYFDPLDPSGFYRFYRPRPWKIEGCSFNVQGFMEVVLEKRKLDRSYLCQAK